MDLMIELENSKIYFFIPPLVTFFISFFTSSGGVSGAFLLLPFQVSILNYTSPGVSATNQLYNVIAIPGGVWRYIKEGRMLWHLTLIVALGTLPGVFFGALFRVKYLPDPNNFKVFAGFVLLFLGIRLLLDILVKNKNSKKFETEKKFENLVKNGETNNLPKIIVKKFNLKKLEFDFLGDSYTVINWKVFAISLAVGVAGGAYGIGGGAIMAPLFVSIFNLPVYTIAGAALAGTFLTSVVAVLFFQILSLYYQTMAVAPNWILGLLFGLGGLAGVYLGARFQKYIPAKIIKVILIVCILFVAIRYVSFLF